MEKRQLPDFISLYNDWKQLSNGSRAELKRAATPDELLALPAFYRLFSGRTTNEGDKRAFQRLIFCIPCIEHTDEPIGLGSALARYSKGLSEKRLFQVVRSEAPNDMIQLRRVLKMLKPTVKCNWSMAAKQLWYWNERAKRDLLEDFYLAQTVDQK